MSEIIRVKSAPLYQSFQPEEWKSFLKLVQSPFFNTDEELVRLAQTLRKAAPDFLLDRAAVFKKSFPGEKFDDAKLRRKLHLLTQLAQDFVRIQPALESNLAAEVELLTQFRLRRYEKGFQDQCQKIRERFVDMSRVPSAYLHDIYRFEQEQAVFIEEKGNRTLDPNIEASSKALDRYFIVEKLKLLCAAENLKRISNIEREVAMENAVMEYIEQAGLRRDSLVAIHLSTLDMLRNPNKDASFRDVMELLLSRELSVRRSDLENLIIAARNFCIRKINTGEKEYFYPLFELYKLDLKQLHDKEEITAFTYKNIVTAALILEEFDWVENFIDAFKDRVEGASGQAMYRYNRAKLHFALQQYKDVKRWLQFSEFPEAMLEADSRIILIKTYLVTGDDEAAGSACENLLKFLKRANELAYHKDHYVNFSRLVIRWIKEGGPQQKASPALLEYGSELKPLAEGEWLISQMQ